MTITRDAVAEHSYWSPFQNKSSRHLTANAYGKEFRDLYTACVDDALRTTGEIGISMSSGLDSASVGALAATLLRKENKTLFSYTYVPYETPAPDKNRRNVHDETSDVQKIVRMYPNIKPHFLNNHGKNCLEFISKGLDIMEVPFKALINLPNLYEVYQHAAKDNCRIVLTGQVGNSTVSHGYIDDVLYNEYEKKHYLRFLRYLNRFCKSRKKSRKQTLFNCLQCYEDAKEKYRSEDPFTLTPDNPFLSENILDNYPFRDRYWEGELTHLERLPMTQNTHHTFLYKKAMLTYLGELDTKMGLATGTLLRDPTRDSRMLQFCANLPYHLFAYKGTPRWLIRGNLTDLLPQELLCDWTRYGVQNSDWTLRIIRDWSSIRSSLDRFFSQEELQKTDKQLSELVDLEQIKGYFAEVPETPATSDIPDFEYFFIILIYLQYIKA
jgi:asparagine synthase (glutamine-hydrolysing)